MIFMCEKCNKPVERFTDLQFKAGSPWHNFKVECHGESEKLEIDRYVLERSRSVRAFSGTSQRTQTMRRITV